MTDTDRELLELAAKAAGFDTIIEMYGLNDIGEPLLDANDPPTVWNPLIDDGDALRLAVKLRLHAKQFQILDDGFDDPLGMIEVWRVDDDDPLHVEFLRRCDDRLAVTRRAITRAAAEIGKAMP